MLISTNRRIMGSFTAGAAMRAVGWTATVVMAMAVVAMAVTALK